MRIIVIIIVIKVIMIIIIIIIITIIIIIISITTGVINFLTCSQWLNYKVTEEVNGI